jgi:hypothetical protein
MIGKDAFEFLSKQAVEAAPKTFAVSAEPNDVYFLKQADGSSKRVLAEPAPRKYAASRIEDFVQLVKKLRDANAPPQGELLDGQGMEPIMRVTLGPTLVMVGERKISALLNEHERRERIAFALTTTTAFETLAICEKSRVGKEQKRFVSMLRIDLNGCVDDILISQFKSIRFEKSSEGESQVSNSNKAVSTKVKMSLAAGGKEIPDSIDTNVCVYEEFPEIESTVRCAVETNIEEATFTLIPLAGELHAASVETRRRIADTLRKQFQETGIAEVVAVHCGEVNC